MCSYFSHGEAEMTLTVIDNGALQKAVMSLLIGDL